MAAGADPKMAAEFANTLPPGQTRNDFISRIAGSWANSDLDGALAWRQHDGGHEDRSNMSFFIGWANRLLRHTPPPVPADQPRVRAENRVGGRRAG